MQLLGFTLPVAVAAQVRKDRPGECPHLGLASDPFSHHPRASEEHRCYVGLGRERVDLGHQRQFCLTSRHERCPFLAVSTADEGLLDRIGAWSRTVSPADLALGAAQLGRAAGLGGAAVQLFASLRNGRSAVSAERREEWRAALNARLSRAAAPARAHTDEEDTLAETDHAEPTEVAAYERIARFAEPIPAADGADHASVTDAQERIERFARVAPTPSSAHGEPEPATDTEAAQDVEVVHATVIDEETELAPVAGDEDLVDRGIAAIEEGREAEAYALFKRATRVKPRSARAWFWRAKTSETLDEVIECLKRAYALEPDNRLLGSNLAGAIERRDASRKAAKAAKVRPSKHKPDPIVQHRGPSLLKRLIGGVFDLVRSIAALGAFALSAAWLLSAVPEKLRDQFMANSGLPPLPLPDAARAAALVHLKLGTGYDAGTALPYALGFMALFVGFGLLNRERWTRLWAPAIALASYWLIAG